MHDTKRPALDMRYRGDGKDKYKCWLTSHVPALQRTYPSVVSQLPLKGCARKKGSERETVRPPAEMGVLILGDSGYTRQDERGGLEQSTGVAGVSGLPARDR